MAHAVNQSYELANWPELNELLDEAEQKMTETQRRELCQALDSHTGGVSSTIQVPLLDDRRFYSLDTLIESVANETSQQRIDPAAVRGILFGTDGLIRRAGGGRTPYLMEDIEVAYIVKPSAGIEIGPIITSGRNRLMAIQVLLRAATRVASLNNVKLRCTTLHLPDRDSVERRIVLANMGSRTMSQAEARERRAGGKGLVVSSRTALIDSLLGVESNRAYPAAFGALVKLYAIENNLNGLTLDQYAAAGVTTYNTLLKSNRDLNKRVDADTDFLVKMADAACGHIAAALPAVNANRERGAKSGKLAKVLVRKVAEAFQLSVIA
jgi:hypothetical protein